MKKVLVNTRTFGKYSSMPFDLLRDAGLEIVSVEGEDIAGYLKEVDALIVGTTPVTGSMLREMCIRDRL